MKFKDLDQVIIDELNNDDDFMDMYEHKIEDAKVFFKNVRNLIIPTSNYDLAECNFETYLVNLKIIEKFEIFSGGFSWDRYERIDINMPGYAILYMDYENLLEVYEL